MKATRPNMPKDYGIPKGDKGLLPWSHVVERMTESKHYWISTVSPKGLPFANPVDGLWIDERLYFGGSPRTAWSRNLTKNAAICVHLEDGLNVVILRGEARRLNSVERPLAERLSEASREKYGYAPKPEEYEKPDGGVYEFVPRIVLAWKQFPKDVTKWETEGN